jgi:hypothetical protein
LSENKPNFKGVVRASAQWFVVPEDSGVEKDDDKCEIYEQRPTA